MTSQLVVLAKRKGGVGATHLATNLAVSLCRGGVSTTILDTDPQLSAYEWSMDRTAEGLPWPAVAKVRMAHLAPAISKQSSTITLIDCPPSFPSYLDELLRQADLILSPCRPALADLRSHATLAARCANLHVTAHTVLTMCPPRGRITDEAEAALASMPGMSVAPARIGQRVAYSHAFNANRSVLEHTPSSVAAQEVLALTEWLATVLGLAWSSTPQPDLFHEE